MTFRQKEFVETLAVKHQLDQEDLDNLTDELDIGEPNGRWQDLNTIEASTLIEAIEDEYS